MQVAIIKSEGYGSYVVHEPRDVPDGELREAHDMCQKLLKDIEDELCRRDLPLR